MMRRLILIGLLGFGIVLCVMGFREILREEFLLKGWGNAIKVDSTQGNELRIKWQGKTPEQIHSELDSLLEALDEIPINR